MKTGKEGSKESRGSQLRHPISQVVATPSIYGTPVWLRYKLPEGTSNFNKALVVLKGITCVSSSKTDGL